MRGGLIYIAGPFHTRKLAVANRGDAEKIRPIVDLLPVVPGDLTLSSLKHSGKEPFRLKFEGVNPETDYLKLDDDKGGDPLAGWEVFFTGKDKFTEGARTIRGFYSFYPVETTKPGATIVARYASPEARGKDGKDPPYIVTMKVGQGMSIFIGSGEIWRLRQYRDLFFEKFWSKMSRFAASGSQRKQDRRGRILMQKEFSTGNYIRIVAQLLNSELKAVPQNFEPKVTLVPLELDHYETKNKEKENLKYKKQFSMIARKGADEWAGYFNRQILATPEAFPPGQWQLVIAIPDSVQTLKHKFTIRQSNPETDKLKVDWEALLSIAGDLEKVAPRLTDSSTLNELRRLSPRKGDNQKLAFRFSQKDALNLIPDCMKTDPKTERNRGPVEDLWDKGISLDPQDIRWLTGTDKVYHISLYLLIAIGLLSVEWITRKLLRLA